MKQERLKIKTAVYAIIEKDGKILLLKRANTGWMDGMYTLPSGHIDEGELPSEAAIRETAEETGITVNKDGLVLAHTMYEKDNYIDFYFKITDYSGNISLMEPDKCSELFWEENIEDNKNIIDKVKLALINYKKNILFSEIE